MSCKTVEGNFWNDEGQWLMTEGIRLPHFYGSPNLFQIYRDLIAIFSEFKVVVSLFWVRKRGRKGENDGRTHRTVGGNIFGRKGGRRGGMFCMQAGWDHVTYLSADLSGWTPMSSFLGFGIV